MSRLNLALALALIAAAGGAGYWLGSRPHADEPATHAVTTASAPEPAAKSERKVLYWHDPMRPEARFDKPGKSPFMDMDLVPVYADEQPAQGGVAVDPRMAQNLGVRTAPVESGSLAQGLDAVGAVRADERRIEVVQSRTAGWVERLHVRAVNDRVAKGQLLAEVYAPELAAAQEEYVLLMKSGTRDADLAQAARARLAALGMSEQQIAALAAGGKIAPRVAFYAPIGGIVAELNVRQGMAVKPEMPMFSLVDLSTVWVIAEVPEKALGTLVPGARAAAAVQAFPGRQFAGRVDYIYPEINEQTRTGKARIVIENKGLALKPGMYAQVALAAAAKRDVLLVPSEAVIHSGTRTVVVVAGDAGSFAPVDVVTGSEAGGRTEILKGLSAGQQVVVSGQFLLDSEANLKGALNRMAPAQ